MDIFVKMTITFYYRFINEWPIDMPMIYIPTKHHDSNMLKHAFVLTFMSQIFESLKILTLHKITLAYEIMNIIINLHNK